VLKPIQDPHEMDMTLPEITARLGIGERLLAEALASYLRTTFLRQLRSLSRGPEFRR
jgi:hypothetical protein